MSRSIRFLFCVLILLAPVLKPTFLYARQAARELAPGVFLVAQPEIADPRFRQTVILILTHDEGGTVGLVINQAIDIDRTNTVGSGRLRVYRGGPVAPRQAILLGRGNAPEGDSEPIWEDVWWSTDDALVEAFLEGQTSTLTTHLYLGYAGWDPGQLEIELQLTDSWTLVRAQPDDVFASDPDTLWNRFMGRVPKFIAERRR